MSIDCARRTTIVFVPTHVHLHIIPPPPAHTPTCNTVTTTRPQQPLILSEILNLIHMHMHSWFHRLSRFHSCTTNTATRRAAAAGNSDSDAPVDICLPDNIRHVPSVPLFHVCARLGTPVRADDERVKGFVESTVRRTDERLALVTIGRVSSTWIIFALPCKT